MPNHSLGSCQGHYRCNICPSPAAGEISNGKVSKQIYMAFVDLENAFDQVPQKVIWSAISKICVEE